MTEELYSVEQVAERLNLHVRTVRNYVRDGRLKAVRIGKQYRISRSDLEELTGGTVPATPSESARRTRSVEVSAVVQVDAINQADASRVSMGITGSLNGRGPGGGMLRVQSIYDEQRASLKIVVIGEPDLTADVIKLIGEFLEGDR
ncbi:helix-turn-helix domain-containing protein [Allokutzneria sp. NRRL B-24872]|uniref:helix-turn-helix domain-containing protein n=1 Tax=Allokutzneria sp. NRRL B-24872 TaxID=1137961 RepID=UPI000A3AF41C|nr:helix-turn-helix domain-containing protein [Allokutzneria sp. NRRL B-24872]